MTPGATGLLASPLDACIRRFEDYKKLLEDSRENIRRAIAGEVLIERLPSATGPQLVAREDQIRMEAQHQAQMARLRLNATEALGGSGAGGLMAPLDDAAQATEASRAHALAYRRQIENENDDFARRQMDKANIDDLRAAGISETLIGDPLMLNDLLAKENTRRAQLENIRKSHSALGTRILEAPAGMTFSSVRESPAARAGLLREELNEAREALEKYVRVAFGFPEQSTGKTPLAGIAQDQDKRALAINLEVSRVSDFLTFITRALYDPAERFEGPPAPFARYLARLISPGASALIHFFMVAIRIAELHAHKEANPQDLIRASADEVAVITHRISSIGKNLDSSSPFKRGNTKATSRQSTAWDLTTQALLEGGFGDFVNRSLEEMPATYLDAAVTVFLEEENNGLKHLDSIGNLMNLAQTLDFAHFSIWEGHDREAKRAAKRGGFSGKGKSVKWLDFLLQKVTEASEALDEGRSGSEEESEESDLEMNSQDSIFESLYVEISPYRNFLSLEVVAQAHELNAITDQEGTDLIRTKFYLPPAPGRGLKRLSEVAPGAARAGSSGAQPAPKKRKTSEAASARKEASGGKTVTSEGKSNNKEKDTKNL